jgi:hypothetical protein
LCITQQSKRQSTMMRRYSGGSSRSVSTRYELAEKRYCGSVTSRVSSNLSTFSTSVRFARPNHVRAVVVIGRRHMSKGRQMLRTWRVDGYHLDATPDRRYIEIRNPTRYLQPCNVVYITAGEDRSAKLEGSTLSSASKNQKRSI